MNEPLGKITYPIFEFKNYLIHFFYIKNWSSLGTLTKQQMCI
jgi:hypothetical protein